jgi:hypothetical protein
MSDDDESEVDAMSTVAKRAMAAGVISMAALTMLSGCVYRERTVPAAAVAVPAASPMTVVIPATSTATRVTYPEGVYELRGNGSPAYPYYWVWVPRGVQAPMLPPPPPLPPAR